MSVLIKGMEMPTSCGECKFLAWKRGVGNHCAVDESITFHVTLDGFDVRCVKHGSCPLVPVPAHKGPLVDALEVINTFPEEFIFTEKQARALTNYIIPADKEGEE